jgi:hypothetical protein
MFEFLKTGATTTIPFILRGQLVKNKVLYMYKWDFRLSHVKCQKSRAAITVTNDCHCCAERRMIRTLIHESIKKGVACNDFPRWLHRTHGDLIIEHPRKDGLDGISIPCVLCRKEIEKYKIQWVAYDGDDWIHSNKCKDVPVSRPTHRQKKYIFVKQ